MAQTNASKWKTLGCKCSKQDCSKNHLYERKVGVFSLSINKGNGGWFVLVNGSAANRGSKHPQTRQAAEALAETTLMVQLEDALIKLGCV